MLSPTGTDKNSRLSCPYLVALSRVFGFARLLSSLHAGALLRPGLVGGHCRGRMGPRQGRNVAGGRVARRSSLVARSAGGRLETGGHRPRHPHFTLHTDLRFYPSTLPRGHGYGAPWTFRLKKGRAAGMLVETTCGGEW